MAQNPHAVLFSQVGEVRTPALLVCVVEHNTRHYWYYGFSHHQLSHRATFCSLKDWNQYVCNEH